MTDPLDRRLADYCRSGRGKVNGWFERSDAELFLRLLTLQAETGLTGGTAEIGVHHGRSFIPLCLALRPGERALAIDVFEAQALNIDRSGKGDRAAFDANLSRFRVPADRVDVLARSSLDVRPRDITDAVGPVRFFSIDGGHWHDIVVSDLELAAATLRDGGVIALDDFLSKAWPDVSHGFFDWYRGKGADFAPVAMGSAKLYLAHRRHAQDYVDGLMASDAIRLRVYKTCDFLGQKIPVLITPYPAPLIALKNRLAQSRSGLLGPLMALKRRYIS